MLARHLDLEAHSALGELFDAGLHNGAILPALAFLTGRRLKNPLPRADFNGVRGAVYFSAAAAAALLVRPDDTGDLGFFVHAAQKLLSADWANVFSDPAVQVSPLQLLLFGLGDLAGVLPFVVQLGTAALIWLVAGRLARPGLQLAVGLAAVGLGLTYGAYQDGHPAQVVVPLLWVLAGLEIRRGRGARAGALLGLAAGFELWGLLGAAVLVCAPRVRSAVAGLVTQVAVVAALFLPFVLAGEFRMFDFRWRVNGDTLLGLVVAPGTAFTWQMRVLQGLAALAAGAAVAWTFRRSAQAVWLAPLAVVAVRLGLDPVRYPWYWLALETCALLGAAAFLESDLVRSLRATPPGAREAPRSDRQPSSAPARSPRTAPRTS